MAIITYVIIAVITLLIYLYRSQKHGKVNLPGPWGIPLFGSALALEDRFHTIFQKWSKKYGDMFYVKLGRDRVVVVSDPKIAREMYALDVFAGRMSMGEISLFEDDPNVGLVNSIGEPWEQLRRFTLRQLRDFGFGKSSMESLIMDEVNEFNDALRASNEKPIDGVKFKFSLAVVNSLWMIVSGERYGHQDPKLTALVKQLTESFDEAAKSGGLLIFAPWIKHIFPQLSGYNAVRKLMGDAREFIESAVNSHKVTYPEDDSPRDFIDMFLREIWSTKTPTSAFYKEIGEKQIVASVSDLFFAGSDTTSTTLAWAMLYLAKWQDVQKKLREEISLVTGDTRSVSVSDRPNMPYTLGLIEELLRYSSIIPVGVPHKTLSDTKFRGVAIPKDTSIFVNTYYIHHNPAIWGDPEKFRPERYLSDDGKVFKKNENVLAFLVGRRACLGETLARDTVFLFLTNIFQQWNITFDPTLPEPPLLPTKGFNMTPEPYSIIAKKVQN